MKKIIYIMVTLLWITGCSINKEAEKENEELNADSKIIDIINDSTFEPFQKFIFPLEYGLSH